MRSMHAQARAAHGSFGEFLRLVAARNDPAGCTPTAVADATGRPVHVTPADRGDPILAARRVMEQALTDVVAECLTSGVARTTLVENRGWLSLHDINRMTGRASPPRTAEVRSEWPQSETLHEIKETLSALTAAGRTLEADRLARSSRTFLRQWSATIPTTAPEDVTAHIAVVFRREYVKVWRQARSELLAEIRELGATKYARSRDAGPAADVTPRE